MRRTEKNPVLFSVSRSLFKHSPRCGTTGHLSSCVRDKEGGERERTWWRREHVFSLVALSFLVLRSCCVSSSPTLRLPLTPTSHFFFFRLALFFETQREREGRGAFAFCFRPFPWRSSPLAHLLFSPAPRDRLGPPSAPVELRVRQGDEREGPRQKPLGEREPFSFFFFPCLSRKH